MSAHVTVTCDKCGREHDDIDNAPTVQVAIGTAIRNEGWQRVSYEIGRASYTELRCPACYIEPLILDDEIIHREPAYDHA